MLYFLCKFAYLNHANLQQSCFLSQSGGLDFTSYDISFSEDPFTFSYYLIRSLNLFMMLYDYFTNQYEYLSKMN